MICPTSSSMSFKPFNCSCHLSRASAYLRRASSAPANAPATWMMICDVGGAEADAYAENEAREDCEQSSNTLSCLPRQRNTFWLSVSRTGFLRHCIETQEQEFFRQLHHSCDCQVEAMNCNSIHITKKKQKQAFIIFTRQEQSVGQKPFTNALTKYGHPFNAPEARCGSIQAIRIDQMQV